MRTPSRVQGVLCAVVFLVAALLCLPVAEIGIYDDWSYVRTAQLLAQTGHIHYNGWATAMLGWQLYPTALAFRLFGISFTVARVGTILFGGLTTLLIQRCGVRCGLRARNASIATLAVVLSPLFLPLATTYMSDIYGLLPIVACLYCCLRAVEPRSGHSGWWLVAASAIGSVGGTARQIAWLAVLILVPSTTWLLRRKRGMFWLGAACCLTGLAVALACSWWFYNQPYAVPESFAGISLRASVLGTLCVNYVRLGLEAGMLLLPLVVGFLPELFRSRRRVLVLGAAAVLGGAVAVAAHRSMHHLGQFLVPTMLDGGNFVSVEGLLDVAPGHGARPRLLTEGFRAVLTLAVVLGLVAVALRVRTLRSRSASRSAPTKAALWAGEQGKISWTWLLVLLGPFTFVYLMFLAPRSAFFHPYDRYCLPVLVLAALPLMRLYEEMHGRASFRAIVVMVAVVGVYTVCVTHDAFAMYRGAEAAIQEVLAAGVPATALDAGWDFSGWTQITHDRFVHDPRLRLKGDSGGASAALADGRPCPFALGYLFPVVRPLYALAFMPDLCGGPSSFAPVAFHTWLPWREQQIYVVRDAPVRAAAANAP